MNPSPTLPRSSGVLLHPTSLPTAYGIGDFGPAAYRWIDSLAEARQMWWQTLPLGPTGYADSPYQSLSSFAGNINLISPELLISNGLLVESRLPLNSFPTHKVDYAQVIAFKEQIIRAAWEQFSSHPPAELKQNFEQFCDEEAEWLQPYSLFVTLKKARGGVAWTDWPKELMNGEQHPELLKMVQHELGDEIRLQQFAQFLFFEQWGRVRAYAKSKKVKIIGDVPIFVAMDSADVWAQPDLFLLDATRKPLAVAGVPPDYFSNEGQLWGNPQYHWEKQEQDGYRWWVKRLQAALRMADLIRLDHFRGFCAAWHVPPNEPNAIRGQWVDGPREKLFIKLIEALGNLPLIAEDLGEITPDVFELRDRLQLPGMKVVQFGFESPANEFMPHNFPNSNYVAYTGTHDNDTTMGWFHSVSPQEQHYCRQILRCSNEQIANELIRFVWSSTAQISIAPLQDLLQLGTEARMNYPGKPDGNWHWRFTEHQLQPHHWEFLKDITHLYNRVGE
ncbi:MAG: 4-alpha-glucanotransferase [Zavarzinella sp.]